MIEYRAFLAVLLIPYRNLILHFIIMRQFLCNNNYILPQRANLFWICSKQKLGCSVSPLLSLTRKERWNLSKRVHRRADSRAGVTKKSRTSHRAKSSEKRAARWNPEIIKEGRILSRVKGRADPHGSNEERGTRREL